jgi:signal transduction histidine kinase
MNSQWSTRVAWALLAVCLALAAATLLLMILLIADTTYHVTAQVRYWLLPWALLFLAYPLVGALIATHRPKNRVGWLLCLIGLVWELSIFGWAYALYGLDANPESLPGAVTALWLENWLSVLGLGMIGVFVLLYFPDGMPLTPNWRIVTWTGGIGLAIAIGSVAFASGTLSDVATSHANPYALFHDRTMRSLAVIGILLLTGSIIAAGISYVLRLRRSNGIERDQLKWVAFAAAFVACCFAFHLYAQVSGFHERIEWYGLVWGLSLCTIPVAAGIAIFKHRLLDIDVLINRTLVYTALTAFVVGVYFTVVVGAGQLFRIEESLPLSLIGTGIVAVAFAPLRERMQRVVNHLLYGDRDDPYAVLSRLNQRLESTLAPDEILPTIVRTMTESLRLPYAAIFLNQGATSVLASASGTPVPSALHLPLTYQAERVGELVVAPRAPGETFGPADRRLLEDLARQTGVAAHAVRLTIDLQRSRERLVTAREEERRRLRRDLHDGLGAQLAALTIQSSVLRSLIERDPAAAELQVNELRAELRTAIADIRQLVHGLRPPALDELGLLGALQERAARFSLGGAFPGSLSLVANPDAGLRVYLDAPPELPPLPAAVEVAVYRIVDEAVTNVARHAQATECVVKLAVTDVLQLTITDDGKGLPPDQRSGVGMVSMRERAEELGGTFAAGLSPMPPGVRITIRLPLSLEPGENS